VGCDDSLGSVHGTGGGFGRRAIGVRAAVGMEGLGKSGYLVFLRTSLGLHNGSRRCIPHIQRDFRGLTRAGPWNVRGDMLAAVR